MTVLTLDAEVLGVTEVPEENSFITSTTSPVVRVVFIFPLTPKLVNTLKVLYSQSTR